MIRTRLNIIALVSVLAVLLAGAALYHAGRQVREETVKLEIMDEISKGAFELSIMADEYALRQEDRPRRQWQLRYDSLAPSVAQLDRFNAPGDRATVQRMYETFVALHPTFVSWVATADKSSELATIWQGNLVMLIRGLDDNARQLHSASHARLQDDWQRVGIVIVALVLIMLAGILAIVFFIRQRVMRPIKSLQEGAAIIGSGNLAYKIDITTQDELGELARAFDQMTSNLAEITASRNALNQEIAERKRAEEKSEESEEHIRLLLNSTAEGIYGLDPDGLCTFCNASCLRLLGYEQEEELIGRNMHELIHHTRPDGAPYPAAECRTHGVYRGEAVHEEGDVFWRRDGSGLSVEYWAHPIARAGKVVGVVVTFVDITERKEASERLRQTMTKLQRSNQELERFAYVASHDLQEPLRMVSSYVQLLAEEYGGKLGPEADTYIGFATDGATRMQRMINDLLLYSRVRTRENPLAPVDLEAIFQSALDNLRLTIDESKAVISHEPLPTVVADAAQLIQVFQNILGNAIKFRSEEPPRIQVSATKKEDGWLFAIRDNGIGFDPGQSERIFQVFQSLHAKTKYPGTGIGLSICKRVVERHGGMIWAESEPGQGATFYFTIPEGKALG